MSDPGGPDWGGDPSTSSFPDPSPAGPLDSDVAVGLLQRAQALADKGDWDVAASTFARVVGNDDPTVHTAALLGLAECRYRLDEDEAALLSWIAATQAPENPLTWRAWKALAAARVRSDDMSGAARAYREAGRRAPRLEQAEIQSRIGWLSKEAGDEGGEQRAFSRSRTDGLPQPIVTYALLAVTVSIGVSMFLLDQEHLWLDLFALDKQAVRTDGEYWRLLTPILVHGSILHLGFNMYALWIIGPLVEALYGSRRFLAIYLICAVAGSTASYVFSDARFSVGASGAVFGLFGVLLIADRVHKPALTRNARNITMQIGVLIAINLFIGFSVPGIDNAAHIGGLIAGAWLGFVLVPKGATRLASLWSRPGSAASGPVSPDPQPKTRDGPRFIRWGGVAALFGVIVVMVAVGPIRLL
ncbi:MAG: rhomboid family intramembrane serine protease [Chloroflexota bacterium]